MRFKSDRKVQPELVAAKDKYRPVLTKVHLDAEKSQVVVTDSFMLARFPVELDEGDTSGPIPVDALKASRKHPSKTLTTKIKCNSHVEVVECAADGAEHKAGPYLTIPRESGDYQFPNVDQLVPDSVAEFSIGVNADKLYRLAKAMGCGPNDAVELRFAVRGDGEPSPLRPILVRPTPHNENTPDGILMPVRLKS